MRISNVANSIEPSLTRKLFNMALEFDDVIDFTLGDPDLMPPENIRTAGCRAIMDGKTRYSANAGLLKLRMLLAQKVKKDYGKNVDGAENVMVTVGGMEAIYLALLCLINPGDEVIIPAPYWINYAQMVTMCKGTPIIIPTEEKNGFAITSDLLIKNITDKTRVILLNTPNNPTGEVLPKNIIQDIAKIAIENDITVIADEVYKSLIYNDISYNSIFEIEGMEEHTVLVNSYSKEYCMTGWRIGYAVAPKILISSMTKLQENIAACAPLPSQYAAIEAIENSDTDTKYIYNEFYKRRQIIVEGINSIEKISCRAPQGTFYVFANISKTGLKSEDFCYKLLQEQHVAVVPGITYGKWYDDYIRIAFTLNEKKLNEGIERIKKFIAD